MKNLKIALIQMDVVKDKNENLKNARKLIDRASNQGAELVVLPEIFNGPYNMKLFKDYSEGYPGPSTTMLANAAKENGITLVGGSITERDRDKLYNTSYIFGPDGNLLGKHRKVHLFDVDIKGKITFKESDVFTPGDDITVIDTVFGRIGVCICYDIRFPELARLMAMRGAEVIIVPAAFNTTTGPAHWHTTTRQRAVDNQVYYGICSPARSKGKGYKSYGHTMIVDPWGEVIAEADIDEEIIFGEVDFKEIHRIRQELPLLNHLRDDIYEIIKK
ncbi:MAG: carbon-nitrogen hydrolase family protein [Firmicutes bacterium]|jgi:predicted amidohydrolase|nr:carbon-nitrogen hydrolase family protein [Bacillota bacterium]